MRARVWLAVLWRDMRWILPVVIFFDVNLWYGQMNKHWSVLGSVIALPEGVRCTRRAYPSAVVAEDSAVSLRVEPRFEFERALQEGTESGKIRARLGIDFERTTHGLAAPVVERQHHTMQIGMIDGPPFTADELTRVRAAYVEYITTRWDRASQWTLRPALLMAQRDGWTDTFRSRYLAHDLVVVSCLGVWVYSCFSVRNLDRRSAARARAGDGGELCAKCGYDLGGSRLSSVGCCPECDGTATMSPIGWTVDQESSRDCH